MCTVCVAQAQEKLYARSSKDEVVSALKRVESQVQTLKGMRRDATDSLFGLEQAYPRERSRGLANLAADLTTSRCAYHAK